MGAIVLGRRVMDSAQLEQRVERAMSGFALLGVAGGDAVALLMRNDTVFVEATAAIGRLGAYAVPVNWHGSADEVRHILADSGARVVVAHADLAPLLAGAPGGIQVIFVQTPAEIAAAYGLDGQSCRAPDAAVEWERWTGAQAPYRGEARTPRGVILYTSGTTGLPKGIQRLPCEDADHETRLAQSLSNTFGIRPGVRTVICCPLYHAMPNAHMRTVLGAMGAAGVMVIEPRFDAERLLRLVDEYRITQLMLVPVMFVRLLRLPESVRGKYDVSSIEWVIHAAAPCPVEVKRRMIDWFGPVINEFYGTSETGAVTLVGSEEYLRKPGTVGRPMPGCIAKVLGERGEELPPGAPGEIFAVNPAYPDFTYRNRPQERAGLDRDGLVATGDVGYFDADGYLFLCDRKKDMVISGGVNIFPAEIESVLLTLPGVGDCAVFGIPDEEFGEVLAVHIELLPGTDLAESAVRDYARERLAGIKVPRVVRFERELPRQDNGKIYKRRLAEPYWKAAGRRI